MYKSKLQKALQDERYSINLEYCGAPQKMYVSRFCGEFISSDKTENGAIFSCIFHQDERTLNLLK